MASKGKKHRLLIYGHVHRQRRATLLIAGLLFVALYALPFLVDEETARKLWPPEYDLPILAVGVLCLLFFLFKLVAPRVPYVQCTPRHIRIQTPLYPFVISYRRVAGTRPNQWGRMFPPETLKRGQRRLLDGILGEGVLVLDLKGWPVSPAFLRWWMPDLMFSPAGDGLVLWVADWMTLNREISDSLDRRREALTGPKPDASVYGRMKRSE
jgi:hypothetical protein